MVRLYRADGDSCLSDAHNSYLTIKACLFDDFGYMFSSRMQGMERTHCVGYRRMVSM